MSDRQQPVLDKESFSRRLRRIYRAWSETSDETDALSNATAIVVPVGDDEIVYSKSMSLVKWLFGHELSDIILVFTQKNLFILSGKRKIEFIKPIEERKENDLPQVNLLVREKSDKDKANYGRLIDAIKASGGSPKLAGFLKDEFTNEFYVNFQKLIKEEFSSISIDVSPAFAFIMASKDEPELETIRKACKATQDVFTSYLKEELVDIIDKEKEVKHARLADNIEKHIKDKKYVKNLDLQEVDICYSPIIQSGGNYNLKFSVESDKNNLHFGAIIAAFGIRYKQYCSNLVRTLLVNPSEKLQGTYEFLLKLEDAVLEKLKPGRKFCDVYNHVKSIINEDRSDLADKFTKNIGFVMGIEFREGSLVLQPKNNAVIKKGMVFNLALGFQNIPNDAKTDDPATHVVSLFIGDTVVVQDSDKPAEVLTVASKKKLKNISIFLKDESENEEDEEAADDLLLNEDQILSRSRRNNAILESKLRTEQSTEEKRKQHQKELAEQLNEAARARLAQKSGEKKTEKQRKSTISYKSFNQMPVDREIKELKIFVDKNHETLVLPIFGIPVPFHISTIKNISQSVEGEYTYLRINFFHPGSTLTKNESNLYGSPEATFLKEITYRSTNTKEPGEISAPSSNLNTAFRLIKEVQKKFKVREAEEKEMEGIVKQDTLVLSNNKSNPKLKDLYIRPNLYSKRISGTLEAHVNGFRFTSIRGDKVDLMYNNIKHAFFQPCDHEMIILIHFTLKNAIMFGKKKHNDVQFYTEVGEITTDLGKHQHMHDRDDLAAEQAERELRQKLKTAFKSFCDKVEQMTKSEIEFDTPFRDLGFYGVPYRSSVFLQPTSGCIVNLTDWPPFVVTLEEIELVHFERVSFHLKNFDMVFIFKDYSRKVVSVNTVPMQQLDSVKEWLNSCDIRYTESNINLNWNKIMKTITDDPERFFEDGGWSFLDPQSDEEGEEDEEEDEEDEKYSPSESDDGESESETDFSDEDVTDSDDSDEEELGSSEESGKDWSDLEEEARKADREQEFEESRTSKFSSSKKVSNSSHRPPPSKVKGGSSSSKHSPHKSNGKRARSNSPKNGHSSKKFRK